MCIVCWGATGFVGWGLLLDWTGTVGGVPAALLCLVTESQLLSLLSAASQSAHLLLLCNT